MKNLFLVLAVLISMSTYSSAQFSFGVKASVGASLAKDETTYVGEVFDFIDHEVRYKGTNIVKTYGVFAMKKFNKVYATAELSYTHFKQNYDVRSFVQLGQQMRTPSERFGYVDFQLMAGLRHDNFRFGVGPVMHRLVSHESELGFISGYNEKLRKQTYGMTAAVALDAGHFSLEIRYINNFRTIGDHIYYGDRNAGFSQKPNEVNFTLGYHF